MNHMQRSRKKQFVIMVHEGEREALEQLAALEQLPASTFARSYLLKEAQRRGLWPAQKNESGVPVSTPAAAL